MAIKKVKTATEWEALVKSKTESTIGLVEDGNKSVTHGVFVEKPLRTPAQGDMVFVDGEKKPHLVAYGTYEAGMKPADWTAVGVVAYINGNPHIVWKENKMAKWADVYKWRVTGFSLDGLPHESTVKLHPSAAITPSNPTLTYQGTTIDEVLIQVQAWFNAFNADCSASTDQYAKTMHYTAAKLDEQTIEVMLEPFSIWWQYSLSMSGLSVGTWFVLKDNYNAYKRNHRGGSGAIHNMARAIDFYESSTLTGEYNGDVPSDIDDIVSRDYAINLTSYLGKSADGLDHCVKIRQIYGEGREGWLKCMEEFLVIAPYTRGIMARGYGDGYENTQKMEQEMYLSQDGSLKYVYSAAHYTASVGMEGVEHIDKGDFFLMSMREAVDFFSQITYGISGIERTTADKVNRSLYAIGGSPISVSSYAWSSSRYNAYNAWCMNNRGYVNGGNMYSTNYAVPVSLYKWLATD